MSTTEKKFNPQKLEKLNNPKRLELIPPRFIWDKLKLSGMEAMADVGAGTGLFSRAFGEIDDRLTVHALDISEIMVQWMRENIDNPRIKPLLMGENEIPLKDHGADFVLMIALHHELDDPERLLAEVKRILKVGGKICIIDWEKGDSRQGPPNEIRVSKSDIEKQLRNTGFLQISSEDSLEGFNMVYARKG